jgi:hypothetical protein
LDETGLKAVLPVDQSGRVYVVGSVPLLHPEAQIVDEMLEGSRNQQLCRTSRSTPSTARPALLVSCDVLDPGSAAEWIAGTGAIFAAAVALNIAAKDRAERREEREVAALAQMRLVEVRFRAAECIDPTEQNLFRSYYQLHVSIDNYGERPILRAMVTDAELETRSAGVFKKADPTPVKVLGIIPPVGQPQPGTGNSFDLYMTDSEGERWHPHHGNESHRMAHATVKIQCIDAEGQHWIISNDNDPYGDVPIPSPPAYQRLWTHRHEAASELRDLFWPSSERIARASFVGPLWLAPLFALTAAIMFVLPC